MAKMNTQSIWKLVVVAGLLALASTSYAAEDTWTRKADMPTARWGLSTAVVDGKIYSIGGGQSPYGTYMSTVEVYDPETDTWTTGKADMPTGRAFAGASVVNGKIYVVGGSPGPEASTSSVEEYDPATDTWTRKTNMPTARNVLSTSAVNGKIYAIGGAYTTNPAAVEEYDPATDTWTKKANMPTARNGLSTSVIDGRIYAIGGSTSFGGSGISTVEEYDPATDTWTQKVDMPTARVYLSSSVVNWKIYAIGGTAGNWGPVFSTVEEYNPVTDTWTTRPDMPTARMFVPTSVVDGKIYAIGGSVVYWPWTATSAVEEYDIPLVVDFNADEIVNFRDFSMLAQYWYQDQSPFVYHTLDYEDLAALADYWLQEVLPVSLIAYWKLDETEGFVAHDSIAGNDAFGPPDLLWRPLGGQVDGALELDGVNDFVFANFVLDPGAARFSVFAWIQGGTPGQVIVSQNTATNWLWADPATGALRTELKGTGRFDGPLSSQAVITDGEWRRVGLTWDGSNRILYVDDVEVAKDTQAGLASSDRGLNIGAGWNLSAGSFWSGLIDDIRIYDRAIVP
jgi:N-acetylneuraminic acid mutarotase